MKLGVCDCVGLFWRHLYSCGIVASVNVIVTHWAAHQDLHALRKVIKFGGQQEIIYESCCYAAAHWPHPVHPVVCEIVQDQSWTKRASRIDATACVADSCQMSQAHWEANSQGCRAGDITPPFISDCNDTQHQLESCQELYAHALAGSDTVELRELERNPKQQQFVSLCQPDGWLPIMTTSHLAAFGIATASLTAIWLQIATLPIHFSFVENLMIVIRCNLAVVQLVWEQYGFPTASRYHALTHTRQLLLHIADRLKRSASFLVCKTSNLFKQLRRNIKELALHILICRIFELLQCGVL